jgi:hypothetical protein
MFLFNELSLFNSIKQSDYCFREVPPSFCDVRFRGELRAPRASVGFKRRYC